MCEHAFVHSTNVKGAVAEQAIVLAATKLNVPVLRPVGEHGRVDLALDIGGRLWRVQVKWGRLSKDGDVVYVHLFTSRWSPSGHIRRTYTEHEIDLFAVYCGELDRCFLLPPSVVAGKTTIQLRVTPSRNAQRACINLADDFDFEGAIAQLGERLRGTQEVAGSSPASSTASPVVVGCDSFRDRLGFWLDEAVRGERLLITRRGKPLVKVDPAVAPQALWPVAA